MARRTTAAAAVAVALLIGACSAGDPPDPDAAAVPEQAEAEEPEAAPEEPEDPQAEADDATLDVIEERYEDVGVEDVRAGDDGVVTIHMDDDRTAAGAGEACRAVREAGFAEVRVDLDGVVEPCP